MIRVRVWSAFVFALSVVGVNAVAIFLVMGFEESVDPLRHLGLAYASCAGGAAVVVGALAGPDLVRARSGGRAAFEGAGVVVGIAALYAVVWFGVHVVLDVLPFGVPWPEAPPAPPEGWLQVLMFLLGALVSYGLVLAVSASVFVFTLWAAPLGAGAGWWLWSRARRAPADLLLEPS